MRNNNILISVFLSICYVSCYKADNAQNSKGSPTFTITASDGPYHSGPLDTAFTFTLTDSSASSITLSFTRTSGDPANYPITCYLTGLPAGVTITHDSETFELNFNANFSLSVNTDTGTYSVNINVSTPGNGLKVYPAKLKVVPVADCAPSLAGTYTGNDPCGHFSIGDTWSVYTATVSSIPGKPHWIAIKNFKGLGDNVIVQAFVNCDLTVNIPVQTTAGYTIFGSGTGYYGTDEQQQGYWISIYGDTVIHAGDTQTCFTQLKQQ